MNDIIVRFCSKLDGVLKSFHAKKRSEKVNAEVRGDEGARFFFANYWQMFTVSASIATITSETAQYSIDNKSTLNSS